MMMPIKQLLERIVIILPLVPLSWAFYDSVPLVAWSSHESSLIGTLREQSGGVRVGGVERLLSLDVSQIGEEVCSFDALIVVEQPGLHASDLRSLPSSSVIPMRLKAARRSAQIPYVKRHLVEEDSSIEVTLEGVVEEFARRCGASMTWLSADGLELDGEKTKSVFHLSLPEIYGEGSWRRYKMDEVEDILTRTLERIESNYPKHLVIYTGSLTSSSTFSRRQSVSTDQDQPFAFALSNSTTSDGGILARYQLLTPGLILSLLLAFFVLLPIVLISVQALAGIQSPVRLDAPRGVTQAKKSQ